MCFDPLLLHEIIQEILISIGSDTNCDLMAGCGNSTVVSCVAQNGNCCDRWNTFNLISGDINSLSLGCLCSWHLRAAAARAPSLFLDSLCFG